MDDLFTEARRNWNSRAWQISACVGRWGSEGQHKRQAMLSSSFLIPCPRQSYVELISREVRAIRDHDDVDHRLLKWDLERFDVHII
jgi:hypothetical protein